jgi:hypothetical protein
LFVYCHFAFLEKHCIFHGATISEGASTGYGVLPHLCTQFKELRNLPKDHAPLKATRVETCELPEGLKAAVEKELRQNT